MVKSFRPSGANENPRRHLFNVIIFLLSAVSPCSIPSPCGFLSLSSADAAYPSILIILIDPDLDIFAMPLGMKISWRSGSE